jgi:hypothetical protein
MPSRYSNIPLQCRKTAVGEENRHGYFMISSCPPDFNNIEVVRNCNFSDDNNALYNMQPVTSIISKETFKNLDCALCNAERSESVVTWQPKLSCQEADDILQINSEEELRQHLFGPFTTCSLDFIPPSFIQEDKTKMCFLVDAMIKECNYTSEWMKYDVAISRGCHMNYVDPYIYCRRDKVDLVYKNMFCAMCNVKNWKTDLFIECPEEFFLGNDNMISFSAMLDFKGIYTSDSNQYRECPEQHAYDAVMVSVVCTKSK